MLILRDVKKISIKVVISFIDQFVYPVEGEGMG